MGKAITQSQIFQETSVLERSFLIERVVLIAFTAAIPLHLWTRAPSPAPAPSTISAARTAPTLEFAGITINETLNLDQIDYNNARQSAVAHPQRF